MMPAPNHPDTLRTPTTSDSEAAYRAILHRPSALPGIIKVACVCAVVAWAAHLGADVMRANLCTSNGGTWGPKGTCEAPTVEITQYHVVIDPEGNPRIAPQRLPNGPQL